MGKKRDEEMLRYIKKRDEAADLQRVRMEQKLDALIAWQKASMAVDEEPGDFGFPFSSDQQFKEFERSLEGKEDKKKLRAFFRKCGGSTAADYARRCFRAMIEDEVLVRYCALGKSPTGKTSFATLRTFQCMKDAMSTVSADFMLSQFVAAVGSWIRHCCDRLKRKC